MTTERNRIVLAAEWLWPRIVIFALACWYHTKATARWLWPRLIGLTLALWAGTKASWAYINRPPKPPNTAKMPSQLMRTYSGKPRQIQRQFQNDAAWLAQGGYEVVNTESFSGHRGGGGLLIAFLMLTIILLPLALLLLFIRPSDSLIVTYRKRDVDEVQSKASRQPQIRHSEAALEPFIVSVLPPSNPRPGPVLVDEKGASRNG